MSQISFRPPAVPLIAHDPFFSVWSFNDKLTDGWTRHWTGAVNALCGMVRIDGKTYRWSGTPGGDIPALNQVECRVEATTTHYVFEGSGVRLHVKFTSPAFADDLELLSSPVAFVRFTAESTDGKAHQVRAYMDATGEWVVNQTSQRVVWGRAKVAGQEVLRIGSQEQKTLNRSGDDHRIDWGHLYLVPPTGAKTAMGSDGACRGGFAKDGSLPTSDDLNSPRRANDGWPVICTAVDLEAGKETSVLLAYDDIDSLEWLRRPVPAYWRHKGVSFEDLIAKALSSREAWFKKAQQVDDKIRSETTTRGGTEFADLAVLSYRQAFAAHKIVCDIDGKPMMFSKENYSNGCIGTVDVLYPAAPIMLWLNPELLEANLRPLFIYSSLPRWKWPFAPHDLGQYPLANGQVYGGGERTEENQMPVEECGNMLILAAALAEKGGAKFLAEYRPVLDKWADYLLAKGLDPDNQLCTDDFAGHLAHNANLSLKAIVGLAAYAKTLPSLNSDAQTKARAADIRKKAEGMAKEWVKMAEDGDHFRLAFDKAGTWSQKYNLVWDKVLKLNLFPKEVYTKELAFYAKQMSKYGLPLDNRSAYTKLDWCVWTACLADSRAEFDSYIKPLWKWANETPARVPLSDWFYTNDGKQAGFQARSVVGGVFMPMLVK